LSKIYPNVYTLKEENSHRFYQMPKELFVNPKYKHLNSDAKVLYTMLLDRKELSRSNNWVDENQQVYLIYTRENLSEMMGISRPTVTKAFKELIKANLIIEERMGLNKPNRIYVCRLEYSSDNGRKKPLHQDENILSPNDTDINKTEKIKRYIITSNDVYVLEYYSIQYEERFNKEHPTITKEQLDRVEKFIETMTNEYDIEEHQWVEIVDSYFEDLSPKNNGSVLSFASGDYQQSVIHRYIL
jgi:DNA-binding Lrp family transcriptional regulator